MKKMCFTMALCLLLASFISAAAFHVPEHLIGDKAEYERTREKPPKPKGLVSRQLEQTSDAVSLSADSKLYIKTEPVPQDVIDFAKEKFAKFTAWHFEDLGVDSTIAPTLCLGQPFKVYGMSWYLFPIVSANGTNSVEEMMSVHYYEPQKLTYVLSRDYSADLNSLRPLTSPENPAMIIRAQIGLGAAFEQDVRAYAMDMNDFETPANDATMAIVADSVLAFKRENLAPESEMLKHSQTVEISDQAAIAPCVAKSDEPSPYITGRQLGVPIVGQGQNPVCWAACVSSIVRYLTSSYTPTLADAM